MNLLKKAKVVGLTLYFPKQKILAIGDLHIGYEEAMNKRGILIPRLQYKEMLKEVTEAIDATKPKTIILLGDVKHEFGTISSTEWKDTLNFLDFLKLKAKVIVLKGNHDMVARQIAKKKDIDVIDYYQEEGIFFCHGDRLFETESKSAKLIIIGHEHPAVSLTDGTRVERYKCFLTGKYKGKEIIVLPSFNRLTQGSDVLNERQLSPFLKKIADFKVIIAGDKAYDFGKISKLRKKLL